MNKVTRFWKKFESSPPLVLATAAFLVIFTGAVLLSLPIAAKNGTSTPFIDALFTATSAVCVTGLVTVNTALHWNTFGHVVIIGLIQVGGLGFMTLASAFAMLLNKKISIASRLVIAEEKNATNLQGLVKLMKFVIASTFAIEGVGAVLLSFRFIPEFGWGKGIWNSVFHSISAYCNAGFDILGEQSLYPYRGDPLIILTIGTLIMLGGTGYYVYHDLLTKKSLKKLNIHSKLSISVMLALIVLGTVAIFFLENGNPKTLANEGSLTSWLSAYFQSVTTRTAGYFSMDQLGMYEPTALVSILLMFVGGNPAGTAGGIKTTTFALLLLITYSQIKGTQDLVVFDRRIATDLIKKAVALLVVALGWVIGVTFILLITEKNMGFINLLYEVVSGFATVGLTRNVTPALTGIGKILIILSMYLGKVGPLTLIFAITKRERQKSYREARGTVLIG